MTISLEPEGRLHRFGQWGVQSGGLQTASILFVSLVLYLVASTVIWRPGFRFDPAALVVTFCALEMTMLRGLGLAFMTGYLADLFSGHERGLWWVSTVLTYGVLRLIVVRVVGAQPPIVAILSGIAAFCAWFSRLILQVFVEGYLPPHILWGGSASILGSTLLGYPVYVVFLWTSERFRAGTDNLFGRNGL